MVDSRKNTNVNTSKGGSNPQYYCSLVEKEDTSYVYPKRRVNLQEVADEER